MPYSIETTLNHWQPVRMAWSLGLQERKWAYKSGFMELRRCNIPHVLASMASHGYSNKSTVDDGTDLAQL